MAIRRILKKGDDTLRKRSHEITAFDRKLHKLLDDMYDTMVAEEGAGLAAPQVGILRRVIVIDVGEGRLELVNPQIIDASGAVEDTEGCLSIPRERYKLVRPQSVTVRAFDRNGTAFERTGEGLLARAFCHEIDHLNGVLFTDLLADPQAQRLPDAE